MKNIRKNRICDAFLDIIEEKCPELTEHQKRKISDELAKFTHEFMLSEKDEVQKGYQDAVLEMEVHRKQFRDHVDFIDKKSKIMLDSFKKQGFFKAEMDTKTNKPVLIGRTRMVDEMVEFMNSLNGSVMDFYKNVYKIEDYKDAKENGLTQTSLF